MKTAIKRALAAVLIVPVLAFGGLSLATPTYAAGINCTGQECINAGVGATSDNQGSSPDLNTVFKTVVNVLLYVIGAISVVMLIFGGIRYTISGGDSSRVTAAKNTIMYALIGLVVAFLAYAIVNWVLGSLTGGN
jgi:hypothetical protein